MLQRWSTPLKIWLAIALMVGVLSGCGGSPVSANNYPLVSVTEKGNQKSKVYRAEGQSVPEVAHALADEKTPKELSKDDPDHMFLVYEDEWYHVQRDPEKPEDSLIEVSSQEFVRQNYNPSFLQGYLAARLIDQVFDLLRSGRSYGDYRGYNTRDVYRPNVPDYHTPTTQEKKAAPPLTVPKSGSIIKRSDQAPKVPKASTPPVGTQDSVTKKGTINRSSSGGAGGGTTPKPSNFSPPKNTSPPKTKVGGSGSIRRR